MSYKVKKSCKTCGKLYTPCADCERDKTAFHWRTVACSYDCGMKYFEKVMNARNKKKSIEEVNPLIEILEENPIAKDEVVIESSKRKNKKSFVKQIEEVLVEQEISE